MRAWVYMLRPWEAPCPQLWFAVSHTPICAHRGQGIDLRERHGNEGKRHDLSQFSTDLELGPRHLAPQGLRWTIPMSQLTLLLPIAGREQKPITAWTPPGAAGAGTWDRGEGQRTCQQWTVVYSSGCLGCKESNTEKKQTKIPGDILEEEKEWTINTIDRSFI